MGQETAPRRLALITGASSGIGQAFARIAAANGFDLCLVARREDRLKAVIGELSAEFGIAGYALPADLCDPSSPEKVISALEAQGRSVDVLVNNAGYSLRHVFSKTTLEDQARFIELTVKTPVAFSHLVLPAMLERGWGRIINIASIAAFSSGGKGHTLYPAGKSFLIKFSQSLSAETKSSGIHVTAVAPGFVDTEFQQANDITDVMDRTPKFAVQSAEEIAEEAWARNEKGVEVVVPGLLPKIGAAFLRYLPEQIVTPFTRRAAAQSYVGD